MPVTPTLNAEQDASRRQRLLWLAGVLILAALTLVVWTQVRQYRLLSAATQHQDDFLQVGLGYLESEYLRLRSAWGEALQPNPPPAEALVLRYEIFVSRVSLLDTERSRNTVRQAGDNEAGYRTVTEFIAQADQLFVPGRAPPDPTALRALYPRLLALDETIHAMVLDGSHQLAEVITERTAAMRVTTRNTLGLTMLLTVAAFGLAILSFAQFRWLDQRRLALESVTDDLRMAQRAALAASEAKTNFLANMSHEIRTPLQGVLGMLALLAESPLTPAQRERLQTARDSADHLLVLLNDILDLSRLEAGKLAVLPRRVELPALLGDLGALMRAQATLKGLSFDVQWPATLPRWVELDPTRVRQVLLNLCSNAIKFTDAGSVKVRAEVDGTRLRVSVEDTGIGIDAATMGQLFQRFGRGNDSRTRPHGGSGLGLEISRQLAQRMGGDISVHSLPGHGSRFVLDLPLREWPADPADDRTASAADDAPVALAPGPQPEAHSTVAETAARPAASRSLLVLVADDNLVNRTFTGAVLEHLGHRVIYAADGVQAVEQVRTQPVDTVLMDLHMPELDGLEATRSIRRLTEGRASVPIVALTADAFSETRDACLAAGMNDFVAKPVSPEELRRLMGRLAVG